MATVTRYIDTASTAGGDGTTENHSGATRAYADFAEWESGEQTDLVTDGDSHVVNCSGSTADSAASNTLAGWTTGASNTITIQGNRSAADNDGFYGGDDIWSTSHYRLIGTSTLGLNIDLSNVTVDGIQVAIDHANGFRAAIDPGANNNLEILRCRIYKDGSLVSNQYGIGVGASIGGSGTRTFDSNVISGFGEGIEVRIGNFTTPTYHIYNNTVWGATNSYRLETVSSSSGAVINVKNCVSADADTADWVVSLGGGGTLNGDSNADDNIGRPSGTGITWSNPQTLSATRGDDFVDAKDGAAGDFHPVASGALDGNGVDVGEADDADDVTEATRDDIGAWHLAAVAGSNPHGPLGHPLMGPFGGPV